MICTSGETEPGWWNKGEYDGWTMWHVQEWRNAGRFSVRL